MWCCLVHIVHYSSHGREGHLGCILAAQPPRFCVLVAKGYQRHPAIGLRDPSTVSCHIHAPVCTLHAFCGCLRPDFAAGEGGKGSRERGGGKGRRGERGEENGDMQHQSINILFRDLVQILQIFLKKASRSQRCREVARRAPTEGVLRGRPHTYPCISSACIEHMLSTSPSIVGDGIGEVPLYSRLLTLSNWDGNLVH